MHPTRLDTWTKRLARTALEELKTELADGTPGPALLGQVSQRVREVISQEFAARAVDPAQRVGLAEELALAVYLTVAAETNGAKLTPDLLPALHRGLARTLDALARPPAARAGLSQEHALSWEGAMTDTGGNP